MKMNPYIDFHTHHDESNEITRIFSHSLGENYPTPQPPYSAGIHPWSVTTADISSALAILDKASIIAVGEIGLDRAKNDNFAQQKELFAKQLTIAQNRKLPVVIHCVKALSETLAILGQYKLRDVVFHGVPPRPTYIKLILDKGYYISLGYNTLSKIKSWHEFSFIPLDRIFLETDARDDISIREVYKLMSSLSGIDLEKLKSQIYNNYKSVFRQA